MKAGELRFRVTLLKPYRVENETGEKEPNYRPVVDVWAAVEPLRAAEILRAQQVDVVTTHKVKMRYRDDIDSTWRLQFAGRIFEISSLINVGELGRELQLLCQEVS